MVWEEARGIFITIVLEYLIAGLSRSSTQDIPWAFAPESSCILTDVLPPDILQGTRPTTMYAFCLGSSNDGILQRGTIFKDEHGSLFVQLGLSVTVSIGASSVKEGHAAIKDGTGGNDGRKGKGCAAGRGWPLCSD